MRKKIGVFGGSFNPVHLGHVGLAINLLEAHSLDHVYFVPTGHNPFKEQLERVGIEHRIRMLEIALSDMSSCSLVLSEAHKKGPSYTIDTLMSLKKRSDLKDAAFYLLLGEDILADFHLWNKVYELINQTSLLIAKRNRILQTAPWQQDDQLRPAIVQGITETPIVDISSTMVRQRLKKNLECRHLVDREVLKYIQKNSLYI